MNFSKIKQISQEIGLKSLIKLTYNRNFFIGLALNSIYLFYEAALFIWILNGVKNDNNFIPNFLNFLPLSTSSLALLLLILVFSKLFVNWYTGICSRNVALGLSNDSFETYVNLPYAKKLEFSSANVVTIWGQDSSHLVTAVVAPTLLLFSNIIYLLFLSIFIIILLPFKNLLYVILILFLVVYFYSIVARWLNRLGNQRAFQVQNMSTALIDIHNFSRQSTIENSLRERLKEFNKLNFNLKSLDNFVFIGSSIPRIFIEITVSSLIIIVTFSSSFQNEMNIEKIIFNGGLIAFFGQKGLIAIQQTISQSSLLLSTFAYLKRCSYPFGDDPKKQKYFFITKSKPDKKLLSLKLQFRDVSFSYSENKKKNIIGPLNFELPENYLLNISGSSGSGKSTLVDLLLGLLEPSSGSISFNNSYGSKRFLNSSYQELQSHWGRIAYSGQKNFFPSTSIRNYLNINNKVKLQRARYLSKILELDIWLSSLKNGLDTSLIGGAANLSGGQRQRLAILRSIIMDPYTLILDEATTGIPSELELSIIKYICGEVKASKIIFISHSLNLQESISSYTSLPICDLNLDTNQYSIKK